MRTNRIRYSFLSLAFLLFGGLLYGQQTVILDATTNGQTITSCNSLLYDSGGSTGNYQNSENYSITFCGTEGFPIIVEVLNMRTESSFDYLYVYDGTGTAGTVLANRVSGSVAAETMWQSTSNCVTITWRSDVSVCSYAGFELLVHCAIPCQDFTINPNIPASWNEAEQRYEGCSNSEILLSATGIYPNNDANYHQSDENLTWTWSYTDQTGNHEISGLGMSQYGNEIEPGAYYFNVSATDENGCSYSYPETIFMMISLPPTFTGTTVTPFVCPGETAELVGVVHQPDLWEMVIQEFNYELHCFDDDHVDEEQTSCFSYSSFPGQFITNAGDIESIGMNMEHSYTGDLDIYLQCPNGQRIQLFEQACSGMYFGEAVDFDEGDQACSNPEYQGIGYDYSWTATATSTMADNCVGFSESLPAGDYLPIGSFTDLVGCPINGEWCVIFVDNMNLDDGTVFYTELHFADHIVPTAGNTIQYQTTFDVSTTSTDLSWAGTATNPTTGGTWSANPPDPGVVNYTFYATDNFGCTYDTVLPVTVREFNDMACCQMPTPIVGEDAHVCTDRYTLTASPLTQGNQGVWTVVSSPAGGIATIANPEAPTSGVVVDTWGEYTFRWTEAFLGDYANCSAFDEVTVGFYLQPTNTFTYVPIMCYGEETTITYLGNMGASATFNWDFSGGIVTGTAPGPYTVHWEDAENAGGVYPVTLSVSENGCFTDDTVINIINPSLFRGSISIQNNVCYHDCQGSAEINAEGGILPYTYSWGSPTNVINNLCAANYTVTATDGNGCSLVFDYEITEPLELVVADMSSENLTCYRSNDGEIEIIAEGGTGQLSYLWSDVGFASHNRVGLPAGNYSVVVSDQHGCTLSRDFLLTQPDVLFASITSSNAICEGASSNVQVMGSGGTLPYRYFWNSGAGLYESFSFLDVVLDETTNFNAYITDFNGCVSNTVAMTVTVSPEMVIDSVKLTHNRCFNSCDGRAEIVMHGGMPPYQYSWGSPNYVFNGLCSGFYTVTVVDAIGCNTRTNFIIEEPLQLMATSNTTPTSCGNEADGTASVIVQGGVPPYSYLWPEGEITYNYVGNVGSYDVTVTDDHNCRLIQTVEIEGPTPIFILPIENQTICKGQTTTLTTQVSGGSPFYNYVWASSTGETSYSNMFTVSPTATTTYTLTVTDANGCTATMGDGIVYVNPDLNIRAITTSYDTICPGTRAVVYVEVEGGNGGPYLMTLDDGSIVPSPFEIILDTTTMVHVTLSDMCGTPSVSDSIMINVRPNPINLFAASSVAGCEPFVTTFTPLVNSPEESLWQFGDYLFSDATNPTHIYEEAGSYSVSLDLTDDFGCRFYKTYENMITVYPKPKALFETNPEITGLLDSEIKFINYSTGAERYFWFFGDNDSSLFESPRHIYKKMGEYEIMLVAESENYCRDTTIRSLIIQNEFAFYAPTSFTPNGDGVNDCFRICGNGITKNEYQLAIFDRWGELVYRTTKYNSDAKCDACGDGAWDGTDWGNKNKGDKICASGVYQWFCQFQDWNGVVHKRQGMVTLIK